MTRLHVVDLPMNVTFRGITRRQAVLWEGPEGWTEWSPFPEYDDTEAARWLQAAVTAACVPVPEPVRDVVPVNAIVPAITPDLAAARVHASGCTTAKVKVAQQGEDLDDDIARVAAVRDALGPDGRIRVDANTAWDLHQAVEAIGALQEFGLEYVEQPLPGAAGLGLLRRALDERGIAVPLAADEAIRRSDDPLAVREVADIAIIKAQPLGGIQRCLDLAGHLGMPVVVSSALETSVGLRAGLALAAALPRLDHACGLQTATLFTHDVTSRPLVPVDGALRLVDITPDTLDDVRAPDDIAHWWTDRLQRVAAPHGGLDRMMEEAS